MKRLLRTIASLLVGIMIISALPLSAVAEDFALTGSQPLTLPSVAENMEGDEPKLVGKKNIDAAVEVLGGVEKYKAFKAYLMEQLISCPESIDLREFKIPVDQKEIIPDVLFYALPEAFHLNGEAGISFSRNSSIITKISDLTYYVDRETYAIQLQELRTAADQLLNGVRDNDELTLVQKLLLIHDRFAAWTAFIPDAEYDEERDHDYATAYAGLVTRVTVCQGYAVTYGYLMDLMGIENYYINSDQLDHAWNLIYLDGVPYFVDVTWDDPKAPNHDIPGYVRHLFFLIPVARFQELHSERVGFTPYDFKDTIDDRDLPTDTRYQDAFWTCSNSEFQLLNGQIYYVDHGVNDPYHYHDDAAIRVWDQEGLDRQGSVIKKLIKRWELSSSNGAFAIIYTRLVAVGNRLFYNDSHYLYVLDPATGASRAIHTPDVCQADGNVCIYGLAYEESRFLIRSYYIHPAQKVEEGYHRYDTTHELSWDEPTYVWSEDNATCTATHVWISDPACVESETVSAASQVTTPATCTTAGTTTYTAAFYNTAFETQAKDLENIPVSPDAHAWSDVTYEWSSDGKTCTATRACGNDASHVETETVNSASQVKTPATCEGKGTTTYTATFENAAFTQQTKDVDDVDALSHAWGEVTYEWSEDNSTCTATRACGNDASHVETETVNSASQVKTPATCDGKGTTTYTATFENAAFTQQTKDVDDVDALGHAWGDVTYEWSADGKTCTATRTCSVCKEVETETAPAVTEKVVGGDPGEYVVYFYNAAAFTNPAFGTRQFLWGDANGDGKVDNKDVVRLKNYVANYDDETGISSNGTTVYTLFPGADANGDGVVNNKDIVRLKNYIANYDETTGVATNGTTVYILGPSKTN